MDPETLAAAGAKLLSATGKFTSQLSGNPDVVSVCSSVHSYSKREFISHVESKIPYFLPFCPFSETSFFLNWKQINNSRFLFQLALKIVSHRLLIFEKYSTPLALILVD